MLLIATLFMHDFCYSGIFMEVIKYYLVSSWCRNYGDRENNALTEISIHISVSAHARTHTRTHTSQCFLECVPIGFV